RDLNWQITSLKAPMPELHDAPIIYLAGNQALSFAPEEEAKLKQFCEEGGIIFGNADCGNADFATSFRKLGAKLFPGYEFRELPASHPIYTNEQYLRTNWKSPPSPLALSNGVREMMVVQPTADAARYWQADDPSGREEAFQFADNLFLYAVDKQNLLEKGKTYLVYDDERIKPQQRIKMGRLEYDGNWDPEPAGWRRMSALLHNMGDKLELFPIKLGSGKLGNGRGVGVRVAHLTGTTRFKLNLEQRKELKEFAEGGGTLIIDAAGGSGEFADSAESELAAIFGGDVPNQLKEPLPPADHVYDLPGNKIEDFGYRPFTRKIVGTLRGPQVKAIKVNDRPAVYYSREDLSAGLVGQPVDGIIGYTPTTATAIMRNLILQGGGVGDKPASTQPAPEAAATQPGAPKPPTPPKPKSPSRKPKSTTKPTTKPATKPKT
ncbi:MAG TPA: DUF4159 domain-containing protein, partial [Tepidisphaeraceae bacterium]|nr:DUF4159 domain-containing protein [Tepidisphaeraceae bacterium]